MTGHQLPTIASTDTDRISRTSIPSARLAWWAARSLGATAILAVLAGCRDGLMTSPAGFSASLAGPGNIVLSTTGVEMWALDLGGALEGAVTSMNDAGVMVGFRSFPNPTGSVAVPTMWVDGVPISLPATGSVVAHAVNGRGEVIGSDGGRPVQWRNGIWTELPAIGWLSWPLDINDDGIVVGEWIDNNGDYHAARWENGVATELGSLGGNYASAVAINAAGQIAGTASDVASPFWYHHPVHAVVWEQGLAVDLRTRGLSCPGAGGSAAQAINDHGHVLVQCRGDQTSRIVLLSDGGQIDLSLVSGQNAMGLNEHGHVLFQHGRLWDGTVLHDLGNLPGTTSNRPFAMNNHGLVAGYAGGIPVVWRLRPRPGVTPPGSNVSVSPTDATTGAPSPTTITFGTVTTGGETTVASGTIGGPGAPVSPSSADFRLGQPPTYYEITTTASFSGAVTICIDYSGASYGNEANLRLLHQESGTWVDITTSLDTDANIVCGQATSLSPFLVAEPNVAPVVTGIALPPAPVAINSAVAVTAAFTDGNPADSHTAIVDWEGVALPGAVIGSGGAGAVAGSHSFTAPGVYTIGVTVSDGGRSGTRSSALDTPAYLVVYDPTSGFVTGGGWINSPSGACRWQGCASDGSTVGKATFGFVSRYKRGANVPDGNTEFQFAAGGLSFRSTSYQWLVVAGSRAQFKGTGTINGGGDFGFLLTAIDGALASGGGADQFRIKLWDRVTGAVVYDNQMGQLEDSPAATILGGGSIVIHR